jgi:hypothetical protein
MSFSDARTARECFVLQAVADPTMLELETKKQMAERQVGKAGGEVMIAVGGKTLVVLGAWHACSQRMLSIQLTQHASEMPAGLPLPNHALALFVTKQLMRVAVYLPICLLGCH